jgi:hypothetical protein
MKVRTGINLLLVAVLLGTMVTPAFAIQVCYDYVYYRVAGADPAPPGRPDKAYLSDTRLKAFLEQKLHYSPLSRKVAGDELQSGDVIFLPGHVGIANGPDSIDHFIILEGTSTKGVRYNPQAHALPRPDPTPRDQGGKIGGLYRGDTLSDFRMRQFSAQRSGIPANYVVWRQQKSGEPALTDWQKALGKWRSKDKTLEFELIDMNRADREYYRNTPVKIEGYIRKIGNEWNPERVKEGDILFVSSEVALNTISGKWLNAPQKGDCTKLDTDFSACIIKIDLASDTLTVKFEAMLYYSSSCTWSDKTKTTTTTYYRVR